MRRSEIRILLFGLILVCLPAWLGAAEVNPTGQEQNPAPAASQPTSETCIGRLLQSTFEDDTPLCSDDALSKPREQPGPEVPFLAPAPTNRGGCCKCSEGCCNDFICYTDNCRFALFC